MNYPILSKLIVDSIADSGALSPSDVNISQLLKKSGWSDEEIQQAESELESADLTDDELIHFCCGDDTDISQLIIAKNLHKSNELIQLCFDLF